MGRRAQSLKPEFQVCEAQLNLLAVIELDLQETYDITFGVITSDIAVTARVTGLGF